MSAAGRQRDAATGAQYNPAVFYWHDPTLAQPQKWLVVIWVPNIACGTIYSTLTANAVVDDFGTLVVVGGFT